MNKHFRRYRSKSKQIVGLTLALIGVIILISVMRIEVLLSLIGIGLVIAGLLLIKIK